MSWCCVDPRMGIGEYYLDDWLALIGNADVTAEAASGRHDFGLELSKLEL
jgi:hypothetical protein